jgi:hypothetical protein
MESRLSLDKEVDIPLSLIDPAPWNAKTPISGIYRRGLKASLDHFGMRDRLKVVPHPTRKGRYYCANGNQRIDVITEHFLDEKIRAHFKLADDCPESIFKQTKDDPDNQNAIDKLKKSLITFPVPCQVMTHLDADTPLSMADAKLFTVTFDRNPSKVDEVKQADVYREIRAEQIAKLSEDSRKAFDARLKAMVRPELPVVEPKTQSIQTNGDQHSFEFSAPGDFKPTELEPWGPNPPNSSNSNASEHAIRFIPMVFSLSEEGYKAISESVLRSKSRVFRENTLKRALTKLEQITDLSTFDDDIDSIIVETALLLIDKRIEALELAQVEESESNGNES